VAIVLNSKVYSAPAIAERVTSGKLQIVGDFSREEALKIVNAMKPKK